MWNDGIGITTMWCFEWIFSFYFVIVDVYNEIIKRENLFSSE